MAKKNKSASMPEDQQAKVDDRKARAAQAAKKDASYKGDSKNRAPYGD